MDDATVVPGRHKLDATAFHRMAETVKLPLYARAGIAELWIVDLKGGVIEVQRNPAGDAYGETTTYRPGEQVALAPKIVVSLDLPFG